MTIREISDRVVNGKLGFAWVCGYPYIRHKTGMRLVAYLITMA